MASNLTLVFVLVLCLQLVPRDVYGMRNAPLSSSAAESVTTQDGYILSMQRIPEGRGKVVGRKTPVLLQHGVLMDGITWLLNSPDQSLAFILADSGFDVWIANSRGTLWSRGHTLLGPGDPGYWDWSWDELAAYDLPAFVQYIYDQTDQKLNYVGHSLGTLIALVSLSQSKLLDMVNSAALLSPIAHLGQVTSLISQAAAKAFIAELCREAVAILLKTLCKTPGANCYDLMTSFTGKNCCLNSSTVELFLDHEPQSTATRNMIHMAQMIREGTIAMYDYGDSGENMKHYGQPTPPIYNLSGIPNDFPLFLSYGGKDALSDVNDVQLLLDDLKSHESDKITVQYRDDYAHADFVMGVNAKQVVYDPMIAFFKLQ
ncbi:Alpha/beta hydrolase fold-1 [Cinnamomum micranthum f. kanehirae]|uniref:Lipase n=1 Tax=Cinnamomum micranthum f. kanehirae TaxID=337451 RepID=A0A443MZY6_9MAGN|nr:Alpha/beta hydrolase fold-1 [Cinnamomum micranthum f. kanehirae]